MKSKIHKIKNFQIMSNGSLSVLYKTSNNFKIYSFLEKDYINFTFNKKIKNIDLNLSKFISKYKNKYVN
jgi:hypothetical protein